MSNNEAEGRNLLAAKVETSEPTQLTRKMRICFDRRDFEALKDVVKEALGEDTRKSKEEDRNVEQSNSGRNSTLTSAI